MSFYGIYIPGTADSDRKNFTPHVFDNKNEAFEMLKNHKDGRLKVFKTNSEAENFSRNGLECTASNSVSTQSPIAIPINKTPFRGPKSQELVAFRKCIEQGKYDEVEDTIWNNPRYLVGSGDTPTILKESFRYNALHVAALSGNARICELILQTIGDPAFVQLLQGKKDGKNCEEVSAILLDLYLNMPEKGRSETPLHLAVKFGKVDVVEVLTSYPQCNMTTNTDGLYPKDVICFRLDNPPPENVKTISSLLEERFYVPVIRSVDNSTPPIVGEPFSRMNPPNLIFDPLSPEMEIQAYAGPMDKDQAVTFRRRWKTPPRVTKSPGHSPVSSPNRNICARSPCTETSLSISTTPRSVEKRIGRRLFANNKLEQNIQNNNVTSKDDCYQNTDDWKTKMTDNEFCNNVLSDNGNSLNACILPKRDLFTQYRQSKILDESITSINGSSPCSSFTDSPMFKERHLKLADAEKGLEVFGRQLAKEQNVTWKEYWNFLGCFIDITSTDGLDKLENHLMKNKEKPNQLNNSKAANEQKVLSISKDNSIGNLCSELDKLHLRENKLRYQLFGNMNHRNGGLTFKYTKSDNDLPLPQSPNAFSAYVCAEKSCQVYAKRMTKTIIQNANSVISINDSLKSELKRLKSLISSYKDDGRFYAIEFKATHSRFANLIVAYMKSEISINLDQIQDKFDQIIQSTRRLIDSSTTKNEVLSSNMELLCLLLFLTHHIKNKDYIISPEVLTTEEDCADIWANEKYCDCSWTVIEVNRYQRHVKRNRLDSARQNMNMKLDWRNTTYDSDDEFWSDSGSEDDVYFTPPQSPSELFESDDSYEDCDNSFQNYILGEEPTKTDIDVLNALQNIQINSETYPHINEWKNAIFQHTVEERNNFPSPSVVVKGPIKSRQFLTDLPIKRLTYSPVKKVLTFSNYLKPTSLNQRLSQSVQSTISSSSPSSLSSLPSSFINANDDCFSMPINDTSNDATPLLSIKSEHDRI